MPLSKRFQERAERPIHKDSFVTPWPEVGLIVADSPNDPQPSLRLAEGRIVEMDGVPREQMDLNDLFIADHAIDLDAAYEAMSTPDEAIARMLVDINVPRARLVRLVSGCTAAKLVAIVRHLSVLEMMLAFSKMRVRRTPANQAHVTNRQDNPVLLAADAAEAALRGFSENETTVGVARAAPLNALAILIGSQVGRPGVLTQCAVEEGVGLRLGLKGLTSYAETLSVYGTEQVFIDGDDTPWSKAFLASAYASRGIKVRFTSGTGSEALMGHAEGRSMLYLEARCLLATRGAGSQGVQNGSISCVALPESLPGGVRAILAENLLAAMLNLEVAAGNDALASHSDIRKTAKLMCQFIPGADFVHSGFSSMPRYDNMFGGGCFDSSEYDDYLVMQRDMQVDAGLSPVREANVLAVRERAARVLQGVYRELALPEIAEAEVQAAVAAADSRDLPERNRVADLAAADRFLAGGDTVLTAIAALDRAGFADVAEALLELGRQRVLGDYLQPAAIFERPSDGHADGRFHVLSGLNDANDYAGPGTGYRLQGKRWAEVSAIPEALPPEGYLEGQGEHPAQRLQELETATAGSRPEVVIAVGPAYGQALTETIAGLPHEAVLEELLSGIAEEGLAARIVKVYHTADCAFIGYAGAQLSGSGVAIGLQSRGTTVIHQRDLAPLNNLELFSMSPNLTLASYRQIGRNAARYARGLPVTPVPVTVDNWVRLRLIVKTMLLHQRECEQVDASRLPVELHFDWEPEV
jgi:propanediol dehydratase large subunit